MTTAEFTARLHAAGIDSSWSDLRDCLWLAAVLAADGPDRPIEEEDHRGSVPPAADTGPDLADWTPPAELTEPASADVHTAAPPPPVDPDPVDPVEVYAARTPSVAGNAGDGVPIRLHTTARALPDGARIARGLRPLKRRVPLHGAFVVDESATVEQVSETRLWSPVLTPRLGRWLDLHLVVDDAPSMVIWEPTSRALAALLGRMAAFRTIRTWRFDADRDDASAVLRAAGNDATDHDPREAIDPTGRSVVLLVSDGVGRGWSSGSVDALLSGWASSGPVALWQPLSPRLWRRTSMLPQRALVAASRPGQATAGYAVASAPTGIPLSTGPLVAVPILNGSDGSPAAWADLVATGRSAELAVRVLRRDGDESPLTGAPPGDTSSPEEIIRQFRSYSSPTAMRLAVYLSAIPLTLETIPLAQQIMLPESGPSHLAEVFLGGLLHEIRHPAGDRDRHYDFRPGVREALLSAVTRREAREVLSRVADHGALPLTQAGGFGAVLVDPLGAGAEALRSDDKPFARVARTVLSRLGVDRADPVRQEIDGGVATAEPAALRWSVRPARQGILAHLSRPMLFVGLGGTGCRVGADLEQQLRAELCGPDGTRLLPAMYGRNYLPYQLPSCLQFVYADLSADELARVRSAVVPGREHDGAAQRTMHITADLVPARILTSGDVTQSLRIHLHTDTISWLPGRENEPRIAPLLRGSGQLPTVGRAVLFETLRRRADTVHLAIKDAIRQLNNSLGDLYAMNERTGGRLDYIDVFVAFSVAGGTGSGLFYDYLHIIGDAFDRGAGAAGSTRSCCCHRPSTRATAAGEQPSSTPDPH